MAKEARYWCCNCACDLHGHPGIRRSLHRKVDHSSFTILEALQRLGIELNPDKPGIHFVCLKCAALIGKLGGKLSVDLKNLIAELKRRTKPHTYLGYEIKRALMETPSLIPKRRKTEGSKSQTVASSKARYVTQKRDQMTQTIPRQPPRKDSFCTEAAVYLGKGHYKLALSKMRAHSVSFNKHLLDSICRDIRREIRSVESVFTVDEKNKRKSLEGYSWKTAHKSLKKNCPTLMTILCSALSREPKKTDNVRLTMTVAHLLFIRCPRRCSVLQELIGLLLWFSGTNRKAFDKLNKLGITYNVQTTLKTLQASKTQGNDAIRRQRQQITERRSTNQQAKMAVDDEWVDLTEWEKADEPTDTQMNPSNDEKDTVSQTEAVGEEANDASINSDNERPVQAPETKTATPLGYTLMCASVDQSSVITFRSSMNGKLNSMVQCFGELDRVPCFHLRDEEPSLEQLSSISQDIFLPSTDDICNLRDEYEVMISRILCNHIPFFKDMSITEQIPHPYLEEMKKKSVVIPLGVLEKDDSQIEDMVDVLEYMHGYVPGDDKSPIPMILYGDVPSCERFRDAIASRINEDTSWSRLSGLLPSAQEWHKRHLLLQDTYKLLYDVKSVKSCGSMYYVKSKYKHSKVTPKVSQCFDDATNLLRFTTEAYVLAAACEYMGIEKLSDTPKDLPQDPEEMLSYFSNTCKCVLDMSFHPYQIGEGDMMMDVGGAEEAVGEDLENDDEDEDDEDDERSCCICKEKHEDVRIMMCGNKRCRKDKWCHWDCLKQNQDILIHGLWLCSDRCHQQHLKDKGKQKKQKKDVDSKYEYSKALLHLGLSEMVRHDAIREGDGNRMIQHWRLDLAHFFDKHHRKYLAEGHTLLMDVNGGVSERKGHQLLWNRTMNMLGGDGNNAGKDLGMAIMNKDYMKSVKDVAGTLNYGSIPRSVQGVWSKKTVNRLFDAQVLGKKVKGDEEAPGKYTFEIGESDTANLVELLVNKKCLVEVPGRSHTGFENFEFEQRVDLHEYKAKMSSLSERRIRNAKIAKLWNE
ncbi:uncharacterized protein LOC121407551 [Lytechinus variegatus]|uniref:uncharacterized protein LOC121407551 n=1 Tax=Lytechinus variegatus TaxID=7654 RepID=UPI001BB1EE86|nr:uncharacterized protein LOC121407551 [Lytechinus variegatus]XP_041454620.1 uncharacterized protein LOC121407551 [Lytechinus variegatus]XP_041454621.1 uncharacterized protein LOC121407551 [Lytechinus variegatus]